MDRLSRANLTTFYDRRVAVERTVVEDLAPDADLPTVVAKVNELLALLREASHIS